MQGLPDRAVRGGGPALPERPGVHAHRHPAAHLGLRGRPLGVRGGVRHRAGGLHLRPRAGEGSRQHQLQHGQAGPQAPAQPQRQAGPALRPCRCRGPSPWSARAGSTSKERKRRRKGVKDTTERERFPTRLLGSLLSHSIIPWFSWRQQHRVGEGCREVTRYMAAGRARTARARRRWLQPGKRRSVFVALPPWPSGLRPFPHPPATVQRP